MSHNPSSNSVERFHWNLTDMLKTRGPGVQDNWDMWLNASMFAYNTSSTGVTPHYAMFGCEATLPDDCQVPNKWQRIAQMVFPGGWQEIHPSDSECI